MQKLESTSPEITKIHQDYAWKAVRVISKFFLKEMKTSNIQNNKIPDLEELTKIIKTNVDKLEKPQPVLISQFSQPI